MPVSCWIPDAVEEAKELYGVSDNFTHYVTADAWSTVASDSGTVAGNATTVGGGITISPSDGSVGDNDETYVKTTGRLFKFADDKPGGCYLEGVFTDVGTNNGNWIIGFMEALAANYLQDNGAGPPADYDGAVFFKVDGGTNWCVETSIGTTQKTHTTDITATSASKQRFAINFNQKGTNLEVTFWHALGETAPLKQCKDTDGNTIKHNITVASNAVMNFGFGAKNGSTDHATIIVNTAHAWQKR